MSPLTVALIMVIVVIAMILWNKIPMNFVMFTVPFICFFLRGFTLQETSAFITSQIASVMTSVGWMLMFGLIFFSMLSATGMFNIIINKLMGLLGDKMNAVVIMIMTTVISCVAYLTANMSTTYLIVFPIMIPLFRKYRMNREWAFIICQTAVSAMCWLPWGIGVVNSAMMAGVSAEELAGASIPWGLCFIPVIILQWVYFSIMQKRKVGTLGLPIGGEEAVAQAAQEEKKEEENFERPKLFWFNLILFIAVVLCLAVWKVPSYLVFIFGSIVLSMVNYRQDFGKLWNKAGMTFFNVLIMLLGICFYLAAFNAAPEGGESMVSALSAAMTSVFPEFLTKYLFIIFLLLMVPIIYFIPYQVYNTMYPLFISIGAMYGLGSMAIIAPFVCNLALATSVTPMNSATYVGCTLCDIEVGHYTKWGVVFMTICNAIVVAIAAVTGVLQLPA